MSQFFQLPLQASASRSQDPFQRFGLGENPFPPTGVDSGVLYYDHASEELGRIQSWINDVGAATAPQPDRPASIPPLAVFGSLGVGKTHLLSYLEQGLRQNPMTPALRKGLADEGMTRLVLADLLLRYLPHADEGAEPGSGLLDRLVEAASSSSEASRRMRDSLRDGSPVRQPFFAAVSSRDPDAVLWLSRWLRREYTSPGQRSRLGLSGVLQSEGEAIRAIADVMRLAHAAGVLQAWFVFIDQLEELWRPNVITPTRRARFLTDLRHLVDLALEGAPIALLLAWNTTVEDDRHSGPPDVRQRMQMDYRALQQRLGDPVNLPMLRREDVWPFAERYLEAAGVREATDAPEKAEFYRLLKAAADDVTNERAREPGTGLAPRKVLAAWRARAQDIAVSTTRAGGIRAR
jgi:hypothetical protein